MNTLNEPGPVSPELVLVDPSLAKLVRSADPVAEAARRAARSVGEPSEVPAVVAADGSDDYDRRAEELRLFLAHPAQDQPFAWPAYELAAVVAPRADEAAPTGATTASARRRAITPVRAIVIVVALVVLAGAGTALGALISQSSDDSGRTEAAPSVPSGSASTAPAGATSTAATGPVRSSDESIGAPRIVAWAPVDGAGAYEVALYEGSRRIFLRRTAQTRLAVPAQWRYEGRTQRLDSGVYRWYVWPVPRGSNEPAQQPVVQAKLTIPTA